MNAGWIYKITHLHSVLKSELQPDAFVEESQTIDRLILKSIEYSDLLEEWNNKK